MTVFDLLAGIGYALLLLLLCIVLVLASVLLLPFRYAFDGETFPDERDCNRQIFKAEARLSWLLRLLDIHLQYDDGLLIRARFAFFRFFEMNAKEDESDETQEDAPKEDAVREHAPMNVEQEIARGRPGSGEPGQGSIDPFEAAQGEAARGEDGEGEAAKSEVSQREREEILAALVRDKKNESPHSGDSRTEKNGIFAKLRDRIQRIQKKNAKKPDESIVRIDVFDLLEKLDACLMGLEEKWEVFVRKSEDWQERLERWRGKLIRVQRQFEDKGNRNAVGILWSFARKMLLHIAPNRMHGKVLLGFDDPASTGQAIAMLCALRAAIFPDVCISSDFERRIIEANLHARGRIRLGSLLWNALIIVLQRDVRRLYKNFRQVRKEWKNGR